MSDVIGAKVVDIRKMTAKEMRAEYWDETTTVLVLDNGTKLYASRDEEGNGPGAIFGTNKEGGAFGLMPR